MQRFSISTPTRTSSVQFDRSRIVSPILSLKGQNNLSAPFFSLIARFYIDEEFEKIIKTVLDSYYPAPKVATVVIEPSKMQERSLKAKA